jgi:hypothetical protein
MNSNSKEPEGLTIWLSQPFAQVGQAVTGAVLLDTSVEPGEQITLFLRGTDSV